MRQPYSVWKSDAPSVRRGWFYQLRGGSTVGPFASRADAVVAATVELDSIGGPEAIEESDPLAPARGCLFGSAFGAALWAAGILLLRACIGGK